MKEEKFSSVYISFSKMNFNIFEFHFLDFFRVFRATFAPFAYLKFCILPPDSNLAYSGAKQPGILGFMLRGKDGQHGAEGLALAVLQGYGVVYGSGYLVGKAGQNALACALA
jgi:hypothetical protein